jgi:hypothetical protein
LRDGSAEIVEARALSRERPPCDAGRSRKVLATIVDPSVVRKILDHLRVRSTPLPRAPARDPTWEQTDLGFDAA